MVKQCLSLLDELQVMHSSIKLFEQKYCIDEYRQKATNIVDCYNQKILIKVIKNQLIL